MKWSIRSLRMFMETRHSADSTNELFHNIQVGVVGGRRVAEEAEWVDQDAMLRARGCCFADALRVQVEM